MFISFLSAPVLMMTMQYWMHLPNSHTLKHENQLILILSNIMIEVDLSWNYEYSYVLKTDNREHQTNYYHSGQKITHIFFIILEK